MPERTRSTNRFAGRLRFVIEYSLTFVIGALFPTAINLSGALCDRVLGIRWGQVPEDGYVQFLSGLVATLVFLAYESNRERREMLETLHGRLEKNIAPIVHNSIEQSALRMLSPQMSLDPLTHANSRILVAKVLDSIAHAGSNLSPVLSSLLALRLTRLAAEIEGDYQVQLLLSVHEHAELSRQIAGARTTYRGFEKFRGRGPNSWIGPYTRFLDQLAHQSNTSREYTIVCDSERLEQRHLEVLQEYDAFLKQRNFRAFVSLEQTVWLSLAQQFSFIFVEAFDDAIGCIIEPIRGDYVQKSDPRMKCRYFDLSKNSRELKFIEMAEQSRKELGDFLSNYRGES